MTRLRGPLDFLVFVTLMFIICAGSIMLYETFGTKTFLLLFTVAMLIVAVASWTLHVRQLRSDAPR